MKFDRGIAKKYRKSVEDAFAMLMDKGDATHKRVIGAIIDSKMLVQVKPVSEVNASGRTGLVSSVKTNLRLATERIDLEEALGEVYIVIAEETIDTGFQRGCEGTFVHEGQHAYDFATALESFSNRDMNPIGVYDPTLYELEWNAHKTAGNYMLQINKQEYLDEGIGLMILGQDASGKYFVNDDGIRQRLRESYKLAEDGDMGPTASRMMGLVFA
ncbi:MAG: hypothetical protein JO053_11555 [Acidobacteria bacterium]|nr:hypothetical protein [Acidobacteriota bacterium]